MINIISGEYSVRQKFRVRRSQGREDPYRLYLCHHSTHQEQTFLLRLIGRRQQAVSRTTQDQKEECHQRIMGAVDVHKLALRILLIASAFDFFIVTIDFK